MSDRDSAVCYPFIEGVTVLEDDKARMKITIMPGLANSDLDVASYEQYLAAPIEQSQVTQKGVLLINSVPKSGTYWMMSMLAHLFDIDCRSKIRILHINDLLLQDRPPCPVLGTVAVVRDLRDVVVSWFYEVVRSDARAGFSSPRYPDIRAFYFEHLLGYLRSSARFNYGRLDTWLDLVSGRGYPLIRYEDMVRDSAAALRKVLKFWKITVADAAVDTTVQQCTFSKLRARPRGCDGLFDDLIRHGHLRRGCVGDWKQELSACVVTDIEQRFKEYQSRLGYRSTRSN